MDKPNHLRAALEACARDSHEGRKHFGQVVEALIELGVESYRADFRERATAYYMPNGEAIRVELHAAADPIADGFDAGAMREAVLGAQRGEVKYPEFLSRCHRAGCVGYAVWIRGRHVAYYGRRGETHVERFPDAA